MFLLKTLTFRYSTIQKKNFLNDEQTLIALLIYLQKIEVEVLYYNSSTLEWDLLEENNLMYSSLYA